MGVYSWMFCDIPGRLMIGSEGYLLNPLGEPYHVEYYNGYGGFGRVDIYEEVVRWNATKGLLELIHEDGFQPKYSKACAEAYDHFYAETHDFRETEKLVKKDLDVLFPPNDHRTDRNRDWLRDLGIHLSCYDEDNAVLPYPIKVASKPVPYDSVPYSKSDPGQGCY